MTQAAVLGLDVGGSSVKYRLASADPGDGMPDALAEGVAPAPAADLPASLAELARTVSAGHRLVAVAVAIPGLVDEATGTVIRSSNVPQLDGRPLGPELTEMLDVPVMILNDGRAAAVAEARWGAGAAAHDVFTLALGTGIAGSHIVDGAIVDGANGSAGELGHVVIEPGGLPCSCGQQGCLETVIGAPALRRFWNAAGGEGSARELLAAYDEGDPRAVAIVQAAARHLADAILTLLALVDPGVVVVGGGLASEPHRLVTLAASYVAELATFHRVPPIVPARLGRWAGSVGAAAEARTLAA